MYSDGDRFLEAYADQSSPPDLRSGQYQATALGRIAVQRGFIQVNSRAMTYGDKFRSGRDLQNTPDVSPLANGCVCRAIPINQARLEILSMLEPQNTVAVPTTTLVLSCPASKMAVASRSLVAAEALARRGEEPRTVL
jgi:hypothetical protein